MERQVSNRYRLIEPLGEGGMGVVWRAYDELLDRTVAVKEVRYTGIGDAKRAELNSRTIREARAAGRLDHPSVIVIHDVIEEDGRPWIVMQLVRSRSLAEVLRDQGPLPVPQAAAIGSQVLGALRAAHATGVLHRDVKPENVLLADDGRVVLTDFGIATLEAEGGLTATGGLVGTPAYMPPERLNGEPARPESDLWSLGATLYAAVEGEAPFRRDSWAATVAAVLRDQPRPPVRAGALTPVIDGLLRRDPAARMGAEEAATRLRAIASGGDVATLSDLKVPRRRARRGWIVPVIAVVAVVAVAGVGGFLLVNRSTVTPTPSPTTTAPPVATATSPTPTPTRTAVPVVPAGWHVIKRSDGRFSIAIPDTASVKKNPTRDSITIQEPGSASFLVVEWTESLTPVRDPVVAWQNLEKEIQAKGEFSGYDRIRISPLTYLRRPAADWEFTRMKAGKEIHVINRGFRTADGRPYALYWETPANEWDESWAEFKSFTRTFKPL